MFRVLGPDTIANVFMDCFLTFLKVFFGAQKFKKLFFGDRVSLSSQAGLKVTM